MADRVTRPNLTYGTIEDVSRTLAELIDARQLDASTVLDPLQTSEGGTAIRWLLDELAARQAEDV